MVPSRMKYPCSDFSYGMYSKFMPEIPTCSDKGKKTTVTMLSILHYLVEIVAIESDIAINQVVGNVLI